MCKFDAFLRRIHIKPGPEGYLIFGMISVAALSLLAGFLGYMF